MNKESYIEERTLALEKALVFHINNQIKKHFKSKEEYVKYYNNCNNHQFNKKLNNAFSIPSTIIRLICGDIIKFDNGKRCRVVNDIKKNLLNRGNIILLKHFHEHYLDSKKDYTTVDRYLINPDKINAILFDDAKISNINSGYYTDIESQLIFKYIMNPDSYLKKFKNMKKRVNKNKSTQIEIKEEQTEDDLEMKTIETEINETKTNAEPTMTTKPDTQILDMLTMMNNKINSLIKDNIELKKELDEIKSSLYNHTVTKVEDDEVEDEYDEDTTPTEEENYNSDDIKITNNKELIIDIPEFKYVKCNAKFPFNESSKKVFIDKLKDAHNRKYISYSDYINLLTIMGIRVENLPQIPNYQKSSSRLSKYYNYFYDEFVKRGYNMFGMQAESDQSSMCFNSKESYETREYIFKAYNNKFITYSDLITFCKIISDEPVNFADNNNKNRNIREYNKIYDKIKARDYNMLGMKRMDEDKVTRTSNKNVEKYDKKEYLTTFNRIFDEEVNHKFDYAGDDFGKIMMNKDI